MLSIKYLIKLISETAEGKDNFEEGAVGANGYGFVFRDYDHESKDSFISAYGSSKLCSIGAFKDVYNKFLMNIDKLKDVKVLLNHNPKLDLYFGGALKTLIPKLKFGGNETLFDVWVFVKTPKDQLFPGTFYYGQSGTSIGGWTPAYTLFAKKRVFLRQFESIINFNPFNFSKIELREFLEAFVISLGKVPISDFEGIYTHDLGSYLMGIKSGKPFIEKIPSNRKKRVVTWSYSVLGNDKAMNFYYKYISLIINRLPQPLCKVYSKGLPDEIYQELIEKNYNQLIEFATRQKSRLAFIVLGLYIMKHGAKLSDGLKKKILKYSSWEYEKDQLTDKKDRMERKRFLIDFRSKIKNYDGTKKVKVPLYTVTRVINERKTKGEDISNIWRKNIDYSINE